MPLPAFSTFSNRGTQWFARPTKSTITPLSGAEKSNCIILGDGTAVQQPIEKASGAASWNNNDACLLTPAGTVSVRSSRITAAPPAGYTLVSGGFAPADIIAVPTSDDWRQISLTAWDHCPTGSVLSVSGYNVNQLAASSPCQDPAATCLVDQYLVMSANVSINAKYQNTTTGDCVVIQVESLSLSFRLNLNTDASFDDVSNAIGTLIIPASAGYPREDALNGILAQALVTVADVQAEELALVTP